MALLGNIIKTAIELKSTLSPTLDNPSEVQRNQLIKLLEKAKNTSFGIYYGFSKILTAEDPAAAFQEQVPLHDYGKMNDRWWQQQQKLENITWPGKPGYFALSSGTTGKKSKRIPVTDDMLSSFRSVSIGQVESLANFDLPSELFEKEVLLLSSSADLNEKKGHLEGEISGINVNNIPSWFEGYYKPGPGIAKIDDWDRRVAAIAKSAPDWDIGAIAGIPSWVQMMLHQVIELNQLDTIHDIWPNLQLYTSGGVAFEPYRESFNQMMGREMAYLDTYLASEGFFAFTARPGTMAMKMALNNDLYYEFIPFDDRGFDETGNILKNPEVFTIDQVKANEIYALVISTPAGAWRYIIGDTIKFTDLERNEIVITGRTKYFLNVVGSQLSEEKINAAIMQLAANNQIEINEFGVAALKNDDGKYCHQWIIGTDASIDKKKLAQELDAILQELNKNYRVARRKALSEVRLRAVPNQQLYDWLAERKKKGGQVKMPKVMKAEMMEDLLGFLG